MTNEECIQELKEELKDVNIWIAKYTNDEKVCIPLEKRKKALEMAIKSIESQKWIPATVEPQICIKLTVAYQLKCDRSEQHIGFGIFVEGLWEKYWEIEGLTKGEFEVLAWKPLPEPYKG